MIFHYREPKKAKVQSESSFITRFDQTDYPLDSGESTDNEGMFVNSFVNFVMKMEINIDMQRMRKPLKSLNDVIIKIHNDVVSCCR